MLRKEIDGEVNGDLRHRYIGAHIAINPSAVPRCLQRFDEAYGRSAGPKPFRDGDLVKAWMLGFLQTWQWHDVQDAKGNARDLWERMLGLMEAGDKKLTPTAPPEAYSYGLTPRLRRGYFSEGATTVDLSLSAASGSVKARDAERFSGMHFDPEIVGFTPNLPGGNASLAASFGWIIGPQRPGAATVHWLAVEQSQLGALIAIPNWWRTVLLRICTGFVSESELSGVVNRWQASAGQVTDQDKSCRLHALRLPGTGNDADRHLAVEVVHFPYIKPQPPGAPQPVLAAGETGRLLLVPLHRDYDSLPVSG